MPKRKRKNTGLPPGTLVFTGKKKVETPNLTFVSYDTDQLKELNFDSNTIPESEKNKVNWYDVRGLHDVALIEKMGERFKIHPLILEDIVDTEQRPKFDEYENGVLLVIHSLSFDAAAMHIKKEQVTIFVTEKVVMSFQEDEDDLFLSLRERLVTGRGKVRSRGTDYLAYALMDMVVDNYYVILDGIEAIIEDMEMKVLSEPTNALKAQIHSLKLETLFLRKSIAPLREAINRFAKSEHDLVQDSSQVFLRDLYDHTVQIMDMIETYRDMLNGLYDLYLSEISFRMNNVMQVLTVVSTIFIPLTFLAGIYGMNFDNIPELHWKYSYPLLWAIMIIITILLLFYFKRKKWL